MQVFISWSGARSKKTALILRRFLKLFLHELEPWMSSLDIDMGDRWAHEIGGKLQESHVGIVCLTPENLKAPWINFEAGALSKQLGQSKVIVLLMGMHPSDVSGPLGQFQATVIEKSDFSRLISQMNEMLGDHKLPTDTLSTTFESFWPEMEGELHDVATTVIEGSRLNIESVTETFAQYGLPEPTIGSHVHFSSGFESHLAYSVATRMAKSRLWIWGRKNRKLFDKDHRDFLRSLASQKGLDLDFRLLFLDPESPKSILDFAHQDCDFESQLRSSIARATAELEAVGIQPDKVARLYSGLRNTGMIVVDDAILHTPVQYDKTGFVLPLTKTPFSIVGSESALGRDLIDEFDRCWGDARPLCTV